MEISIYNSGLAFSGVLTTLLAMLQLTFVEEKDVVTQVQWYVILVVFTMSMINIVFIVYIRFYQKDELHFASVTFLEEQEERALTIEVNLIESNAFDQISETIKEVWPLLMHLFFMYTVSMMNTPSLSFELGLSWKSPMAE